MLVVSTDQMYPLAVRIEIQVLGFQCHVNIGAAPLYFCYFFFFFQDCTFLNKKEVLRVLNRFLELEKDFKKGNFDQKPI